MENNNYVFEGWESAEDIDFFGSKKEDEITTDVLKEGNSNTDSDSKTDTTDVTNVDNKKEENKENSGESSEPKVNFFGEGKDNEQDEDIEEDELEDEESDVKSKQVSSSVKSTLNFLKDKGIIDYDIEEGEELTEEKAEELLQDKFEESIDLRVEELVQDLPDLLKNMIKYHKDGGNIEVLLSQMKSSVKINKDTDIDDKGNQEIIVREHLKSEGYDEDYIETNIEFLKDSGKLESTSKKLFDKIIEKQESELKNQTKKQTQQREALRQRQREFKAEMSKFLNENDSVGKVKFNLKEKKDLPSYIADTTIKLDNGQSISALQRDLYEALQNKEKTLLLAKIIKSNFDFSDISKAAATEVTKEVKKGLQHSQNLTVTKSGGSSQKRKRDLAEFSTN